MSYSEVERALSEGASPAMLCATCPWDRNCITPPEATKADYDRAMEEQKAKDEANADRARSAGREVGPPMGSLMTALTMAGRHQMAHVCPVFVVRLRSSDGREIVDGIKTQMQAWDDEQVAPS